MTTATVFHPADHWPLPRFLRRVLTPARDPATVVNCYALFDKFFPACGMLDYTEGMFRGDPATPLELAQRNQIEYVLDQAGCTTGTRVLEIGCGNGNLLAALRERGAHGIGITISPEQVQLCLRRGLDARLLNYRALNGAYEGRFDAVILNGSIEHFVQPQEAARGRTDAIYRRMFDLCQRALDPSSPLKRLVNTTIHFTTAPEPKNLLRSPLAFRWNSPNFHWAMLARSFGGWYPTAGQFERCAAGRFKLLTTTDGTQDYHWTSEAWLGRIREELRTTKALSFLRRSFPVLLRHPKQSATMFACMLGSQSWNWQFRGANPPTRLLRQTWVAF